MDRQAAAQRTPVPDRLDRPVIVTGLVVVAGLIMVVLDTTIVNVAIDTLSRQLAAPLSTTQWVITGYLLAVGLVIPLTGWAIDRFGAKRVWITSLVLFTAGSALCALAWSMESLIVFRILQGLGGGMLLPGGQTIIARSAGPQRMGRAMSIIGVPMLLGPVLGPVVGGLIVEYVSWHWIFLVNVPVGILAVALAVWRLPGGGQLPEPGRLDLRGLLLLSGGLICLLYGLSRASTQGGFGGWGVLGWLLAGAAGVALFSLHSLRRGAASIIDVRLFVNRYFAAGSVMIFLVAMTLFGGMLLLPLYYQAVRGEGALNAGLLLAPQGLGAMLVMPVAGRLTDRIGAGYVVPVGIVLALLGTLPFTQVGANTSYALLGGALFVRGLGIGAVMMPTFAAAYSRLSNEAVSRAAPTLTALQQVGASLGSALLVTMLTQRITQLFTQHGLAASGAGADALGSVPPQLLPRVAPLLADSFGFAFWVAFFLTVALFVPALLLPRYRKRVQAEVPSV
ncbi:MDR family MFS transporter [Saccharomonospora sp. NPDC046836]|uniref:MDR family MFS transporter n=1 Tax=Saccharomonospora sp. NPDC046836 TaxID=3156921 RepID=UPI0033DD3E36